MNDFQLTMLAAKAAGFDTSHSWNKKRFTTDPSNTGLVVYLGEQLHNTYWDPLNDKGDAFHLIVALKLDIDMNERSVSVWVNQKTSPVSEEYGSNEAAAVRRAIVRAAALIGEAL
jgi:hypothetical protein